MKLLKRIILGIVCVLAFFSYLAFVHYVVHAGKTIPERADPTPVDQVDVRSDHQAKRAQLIAAPWQGLRFLSTEREWRFYAVAGEKRTVDLMVPFDLVQVFYLGENGVLSFTWAALGAEIPGQGYVSAYNGPIQPGNLVEVALSGDYVTQNGVYWEDCKSEYCHLAEKIDTILVLDDKSTGITNGFIRYGWEPPTYPMYGFLCWQVRRVGQDLLADNVRSLP
jgi:hypothetical protein